MVQHRIDHPCRHAQTDRQILDPDLADEFAEKDHIVARSRQTHISQDVISLGGETRYYRSIRFPIVDHKNDLSAVCTIAEDITGAVTIGPVV